MVDLGTLGGTNSQRSAVANTGQVAGASGIPSDSGNAIRAFSWSPGGRMINLGSIGGTISTPARSTTTTRWSVKQTPEAT